MKRSVLFAVAVALMTIPAWSKPITVNGHYFEFASVACPNTNVCSSIGQFAAVPAGNELIVTQASCVITSTGTAKIQQVFLGASSNVVNAPVRIHYVVPTLVGTAAGGRQYSLNQQVMVPMQGRERPFTEAVFDQAATIAMACSISGNLTP